jgi:thiamine transport system substrate-binding protein
MPSRRTILPLLLAAALVLTGAGCGEDGPNDAGPSEGPVEQPGASRPDRGTVRLLTHDSFNVSDEVLEAFTTRTGYEVEIVKGGDAVAVVNAAILTAGNPQADVLFGIDDNLLSRAFDADLFEPYASPGLDRVPADLRPDPENRVTPIDRGDVCVNYDKAGLAERGLEPPDDLDDLADPAYRDLLVVQNPQTSTPGLAFLLATVARYGPDGFAGYWERLRANGVEVVDGWEAAYYGSFSGGSGEGDNPLVVSYASSPPAEVLNAPEPVDDAPTGVVVETCYRQVEYAGVLTGAENPEGARALIDFLLSDTFQADVPLQMYVYPVVEGTPLPEVFVRYSVVPPDPFELDPAEVGANRDAWVRTWTEVMTG